jgi:hypothetical protein
MGRPGTIQLFPSAIQMASGLRFLGKLKRRSVFKVAAAYVVSSWLLLQVAAIVVPAFGLPDWTMRGILIALIVGFPIACGLAWAYELTADGVVLDRGDDMAGDQVLPASDTFGRLASWETLLVVGALGVAVVGGIAAVFTVGGAQRPTWLFYRSGLSVRSRMRMCWPLVSLKASRVPSLNSGNLMKRCGSCRPRRSLRR